MAPWLARRYVTLSYAPPPLRRFRAICCWPLPYFRYDILIAAFMLARCRGARAVTALSAQRARRAMRAYSEYDARHERHMLVAALSPLPLRACCQTFIADALIFAYALMLMPLLTPCRCLASVRCHAVTPSSRYACAFARPKMPCHMHTYERHADCCCCLLRSPPLPPALMLPLLPMPPFTPMPDTLRCCH